MKHIINKILIPVIMLGGCYQTSRSESIDKTDIKIFDHTPVWELVKAIENNDSKTIKDLIHKSPELLDYQEPIYGISPIQRAVGRRKYDATKTLIELGADINLQSKIGDSPIFDAIGYQWGDRSAIQDDRMLLLLLESGANPNITYNNREIDDEDNDVIEPGTTPLIFSIAYSYGYPLVQLLVEYGADINAKTPLGTTAAIEALRCCDINSAYYLIVLRNASVTDPYFYYKIGTSEVDVNHPLYPVDLLLLLTYKVDSKDYEKKKAIINKFEEYGVRYQERKNNIPKTILEKMKIQYPTTWKDYLKIY